MQNKFERCLIVVLTGKKMLSKSILERNKLNYIYNRFCSNAQSTENSIVSPGGYFIKSSPAGIQNTYVTSKLKINKI